MRVVLVLMLFTAPAALSAQIAPKPQSDPPFGPVTVRTQGDGSATYENDVARDLIRDGRRSGSLSKQQARGLRREASVNDGLAERYGRDGLSASEQRELDMRGRALQSLIQAQRSQPRRP